MNWIRRILIFTLCSQSCPNKPDSNRHQFQLSELGIRGQISSILDNMYKLSFSHLSVVFIRESKSSGVQSTHHHRGRHLLLVPHAYPISFHLRGGLEMMVAVVLSLWNDRGGHATVFSFQNQCFHNISAQSDTQSHHTTHRLTKVNWKIESRG